MSEPARLMVDRINGLVCDVGWTRAFIEQRPHLTTHFVEHVRADIADEMLKVLQRIKRQTGIDARDWEDNQRSHRQGGGRPLAESTLRDVDRVPIAPTITQVDRC